MLLKTAKYTLIDAQPLNLPIFEGKASYLKADVSLFDASVLQETLNVIKTASKTAEMETDGDSPDFDLEAEIRSHPDSLFVKCFAIKADETNDNGDHFQKDELRKATGTFVGCPVFTNHNNSDAEESRGKVVHSWWTDERNGIMIIARVDAEAYPKLARGIKEEYIMGTSMGCQVQYSVCSICHTKAENQSEYCSHIRERKTRKLSEKGKCKYHENGGDEPCPICDCKKGETKKFDVKDEEAFEFNYGIKFIENSFVVNPACHDCGITEIIDPQEFLKKVAVIQSTLPRLLKAAASHNVMCCDTGCVKFAGQTEIDSLNQALDLMTTVSQSMLQQKDQLDLEFLSDLVTVLSDLQTVTDELSQQGYARLPSPSEQPGQPGQPGQQGQGQEAALQPLNPTPGGGSSIQSGSAGEAGTVTSPMASRRFDMTKIAMALQKESRKTFRIKKIFQNRSQKQLNFGR